MSKISVNDLTFYDEGSYDNIFENVSFQIDTDWKLGFDCTTAFRSNLKINVSTSLVSVAIILFSFNAL